MKILVFGKTGQVATELRRQADVTALDRTQADLTDSKLCAGLIFETDADVVINAAAYTDVDKAEEDEASAQLANGVTPGAMAQAAAVRGIPFLHISTDYVFDGSGDQPRAPEDAVAPINAYGRSKLAGEMAIRAADGPHAILRTSWVFSAHGSNFVKTMLRLAETHKQLSVVNDQIGGPTSAADIAATLLHMAAQMHDGRPGGTYHYAGEPTASWAEFAREIFMQSGKAINVRGIPTNDYPTPAKRPLNSRLNCATLETDFGIKPPAWPTGLTHVLEELRAN